MKALLQDAYGDPRRVLRLAEVEKPTVAEDQVLVRVIASSINSGDWRRVRARPWLVRVFEGWRRPRTGMLGGDAAGEVEAVGRDVEGIVPGDQVFGLRSGALAEYVAGKSFVLKPANLTFEQAAAVPIAGVTALQALRERGGLKDGQRVLVNGAGGGVGSHVVQIAKALGGTVTAVTSTDKLELVRSLGADDVVDYRQEDFTRRAERYDLIVDCGGNRSVRAFRRVLRPGGRLVLVAAGTGPFGALGRFVGSQVRRRLLKQQVISFIAGGPYGEQLATLRALIEAGKVRPVIDRTYSLEQAAEAFLYAETERTAGKVVITI